jgi:L-threonylcarbamoyladenylate synthase
MPKLPLALSFLECCDLPVAAPSANVSGRPSPTTWQAVAEDLDGRIDCVLQGDPSEIGLESTVVDCTGDRPLILRHGAITLAQLQAVVPSTEGPGDGQQLTGSPGTRHRHYQPKAKVVMIEHPQAVEKAAGSAYIGLARSVTPFDHQLICRDIDEYARAFYEFLRESDRRGIDTIYCEQVDPVAGAALMDRLRRAAE